MARWLFFLVALVLHAAPLPAEKPARGMFLVADRDLRDPSFSRSVVLLIDYGDHGAAGLIVNRHTEALLGDLLPEVEAGQQLADRVFLGGPVMPDGVLVLLRADSAPDASRPVFDNVYVTASREVLDGLAREGGDFRVYAGHAGWAPGQLDWEIRQGGWALVRADAEIVFDDQPEEVWRKMQRRANSPIAAIPLSEAPDQLLEQRGLRAQVDAIPEWSR